VYQLQPNSGTAGSGGAAGSAELSVLVPPLLGQLAQERVPRQRQAALQRLYDLALDSPDADWEEYLGQVLLVVMESLSERSTCLPALQVRVACFAVCIS
jgi:hypothetical protein